MKHLMAVEISFPEGVIMICEVLVTVNYFDAEKGKSLNCRVFIVADMRFLCMYTKLHNLFSNNFLYSSIIQFFFIQSNFSSLSVQI